MIIPGHELATTVLVIPAKAGIQESPRASPWIPACAGMTASKTAK
jgi:hypothetical protein